MRLKVGVTVVPGIVSELAGRVIVKKVVAVELSRVLEVLVGSTTEDSVEDIVDAGSSELVGVGDSVSEEGVAEGVEVSGNLLVWVTVGVIVTVMIVSTSELLGTGVATVELDDVATAELDGVADGS